MAEEIELKPGTQILSRKVCEEILKKYEERGIFKKRSKIPHYFSVTP